VGDVEVLPSVVLLLPYQNFANGERPVQTVFGCFQRFLVKSNSVVIALGIFLLKASELHSDVFVAGGGVEADDVLLEVWL